jgi:hypothetical protein
LAIGGDGGLVDDAGFAEGEGGGEGAALGLGKVEGVLFAVPLDVGEGGLALGVDGEGGKVGLEAWVAEDVDFREEVLGKEGGGEEG